MTLKVLFLCPHSAAKSVMASARLQQIAEDRNLDVEARFAGIDPDDSIWPSVVDLLAACGVDVSMAIPRAAQADDFAWSDRVISLGCEASELQGIALAERRIEYWHDVPLASEDLDACYFAIVERVDALVKEFAAEE